MHTSSGLLTAIEARTITLADAGAQTLAFIKEHVPEAWTVPLCGNSIGTDRRFLAAWLPEIEEWLHYRSVDVSTIKELARRWYPGVVDAAPGAGLPPPPVPSTTSSRAWPSWPTTGEHVFRLPPA